MTTPSLLVKLENYKTIYRFFLLRVMASIKLAPTSTTPGGDDQDEDIQPPNAVIYHSASYETTPLLSFTGTNDTSSSSTAAIVLQTSARNYNNTSNKAYNNNSGRYPSVPKYPSNRSYQPPPIPGLYAVLITVVLQSIGFTLVLPSMYLYLGSV